MTSRAVLAAVPEVTRNQFCIFQAIAFYQTIASSKKGIKFFVYLENHFLGLLHSLLNLVSHLCKEIGWREATKGPWNFGIESVFRLIGRRNRSTPPFVRDVDGFKGVREVEGIENDHAGERDFSEIL